MWDVDEGGLEGFEEDRVVEKDLYRRRERDVSPIAERGLEDAPGSASTGSACSSAAAVSPSSSSECEGEPKTAFSTASLPMAALVPGLASLFRAAAERG